MRARRPRWRAASRATRSRSPSRSCANAARSPAPISQAIVRDFGAGHAAIIAARETAKPAEQRADRRAAARRRARIAAPRDSAEIGIAELFFSADPPARRMLLMSLGNADTETPQSVQPLETIRALEAAALARDRVGFTTLIESALSLTPRAGGALRARSVRRAAAGGGESAGDAAGRAAARADVHRSGDRRIGRQGVRSRGVLRAHERGRRAQDHRQRARPRAGARAQAGSTVRCTTTTRRDGRAVRRRAPRRRVGNAGACARRAGQDVSARCDRGSAARRGPRPRRSTDQDRSEPAAPDRLRCRLPACRRARG